MNPNTTLPEPTINWAEVSRRLDALGIPITYSRMIELLDENDIPYVINTLSRRGGNLNRRFWWSVIEQFILSRQVPVNKAKAKLK